MRHAPNFKAEKFRVGGPPRTNHGTFLVPYQVAAAPRVLLRVLVGQGGGWDHVSVGVQGGSRTPTWEEMEFVRTLFFRDDETAMQLSVPRAEHINLHPGVLHWWRPQTAEEMAAQREEWLASGEPYPYPEDLPAPGAIPRPPAELV